jgi:nicotinamidase-related amidase
MRGPAGVALVLVDVINAFDFRGAGALVKAATRVAPNIRRLAERARRSAIPVIYVNDNFGQWRSDFRATIRACAESTRGQRIIELVEPKDGDYFVLKPQHSGFYCTTLAPLLDHLRVHTLVLAGFATNLCVLFTANDAHMRGYQLVVPSDCTAANTPALKRAALMHIRVALAGEVRASPGIQFAKLEGRSKKPRGQPFR